MELPVQCQARQGQLLVVHQYSDLEGAVHQRRLQDEDPPVHEFGPVHLSALLQKLPGLLTDC